MQTALEESEWLALRNSCVPNVEFSENHIHVYLTLYVFPPFRTPEAQTLPNNFVFATCAASS